MLVFCKCLKFNLWYDDGVRVCVCGHPDTQHLDGDKSCTGESELIHA